MSATKEQLEAIAQEINRHYIPYGDNYKQTCICGHTLRTGESLRMHVAQALLDSGLVVLPPAPLPAEVEAHDAEDDERRRRVAAQEGIHKRDEQAKQREAAAVAAFGEQADAACQEILESRDPDKPDAIGAANLCGMKILALPRDSFALDAATERAYHDGLSCAAAVIVGVPLDNLPQSFREQFGKILRERDERATKPLRERVDQLEVQLAGCLTVAAGNPQEHSEQGEYGWSPAYQATLDLRLKHDALRELVQALVDTLDCFNLDSSTVPCVWCGYCAQGLNQRDHSLICRVRQVRAVLAAAKARGFEPKENA